jgi:hypothetical protein
VHARPVRPRSHPRPRPAAAWAARAVLAILATAPVAVLVAVTPGTWQTATAPAADAGSLLAGLAALAGWVVAIRLLVTGLAVVAAALPGAVGGAGRRMAAAWSPQLVRGLVRAALGAAMVGGPLLASTSAFADQSAFPVLDRVIAVTAPAASTPVKVVAAPTPVHRAGSAPVQQRRPGRSDVVVVRPGDSLWEIAAEHLPPGHTDAQVARAWPRWYAANRQVIGGDPDQILPGTHLVPPAAAS